MQKIKMSRGGLLTFEEGCNKHLENAIIPLIAKRIDY